ncbi:Peroxide stress-activated histidine kinase mak1 [Apiospora rasikravindrae]|uniref:histidine kinase n=1 Tax=Apiospora rasikravindrae TaxID=990691 RepID=A0ABR1UA11_9PEZI
MGRLSEVAREREVVRYASHLYEIAHKPQLATDSPCEPLPTTCADPVLTGLAQLGALRLDAARCLISIFDRTHQHVVAEATSSSVLAPGNKDQNLWLGGIAIPREQGVCEHVLIPDSDAGEASSDLPILCVPDMRADPRFKNLSQVENTPYNRFYAGVPIKSPKNINIGVYSVYSDQPRGMLSDAQAQFLRDVSQTISGYLESRRSDENLKRSDRMVRGIVRPPQKRRGSDVSPHTRESAPPRPHPSPLQPCFPGGPFDSAKSDDSIRSSASLGAPATITKTKSNVLVSSPMAKPPADDGHTLEVKDVFAEAASTIRDALEVEGVVFLDAVIGSFAGLVPGGKQHSANSSIDSTVTTPGEEGFWKILESYEGQCCKVLGSSTSDDRTGDKVSAGDHRIDIPERFLKTLLKRYASGKIFNLEEDGSVHVGDSSEGEYAWYARRDSVAFPSPLERSSYGGHSQQYEGKALSTIFTGARSVAFIPLWDSGRERWSSGCFVWTKDPARVFTVDAELSYLRACGMTIMSGLARVDTMMAEKAKSDVLNSLSHELRSPLHGIVAAVELLDGTDLDAFQGEVLHSMECCGRTLLDVMDHLLDYSKINKFMKDSKDQYKKGAQLPRMKNEIQESFESMTRKKSLSFSSKMTNLSTDIDLSLLTEQTIESIMSGHNFQKMSIPTGTSHIEAFGQHSKWANPMDVGSDTPSVYLDLDPIHEISCRTEAGALRRIIMNLLGNSLKYTTRGYIYVSLRKQDPNHVLLVVADSGKGISDDFLHHHLFSAFSQEDALNPGTGLGLKLVQQITKVLGGSIHVESQVSRGTAVSVTLPLLSPYGTVDKDSVFRERVEKIRGLRVSLRGFKDTVEIVGLPGRTPPSELNLMETLCRHWLHLDVVKPDSRDVRADIIMCADQSLNELAIEGATATLPPVVVVCRDSLAAHRHAIVQRRGKEKNVLEFMSQPAGPRKVAQALVLSLSRWNATSPSKQDLPLTPPDSASWSDIGSRRGSLLHSSPSALLSRTASFSEERRFCRGPQQLEVLTELEISRTSSNGSPINDQNNIQPPAHNTKYLLVDDNKINLQILVSFLKKLKKPYATANNGLEALEKYMASPGDYRCVLMDISMPIMDGLESTRRIREFEQTKAQRPATVIALTGLASEDVQREAYASGIDVFMTKPVRLKTLEDTISNIGV